jgi:hypothetical protein
MRKSHTFEVIGDVHGNAVVGYQDRVLSTSATVATVTKILSDAEAAGTIDEKIQNFIPPGNTDRWVDRGDGFDNASEIGSIVRCVVDQNASILILWRGRTGKRLANRIARSHKNSEVMPCPLPATGVVRQMTDLYREAAAFPATPLWLHEDQDYANTPQRLGEVVLNRRVIVLIAEHIAYWEIDAVLAATVSQGTPVLLVTFFGHRAQIGPLVLGGNASIFYASRLGPRASGSVEIAAAAKLLSASEKYTGVALDVVAAELSSILASLPDSLCISIREVGEDASVHVRLIFQRQCLLDSRLEGTLWSVKSVLATNVAADDSAWARAARHVQDGRVVSIDAACRNDVAQIVHHSLATNDRWGVHEGLHPYFSYHHHNIYNIADMSPAMLIVSMIFASASTVEMASELAGCDCRGAVQQSASWYMPGDHSTPHSDAAFGRTIAFVWHLAEAWEPTWGGHLVWVRGDKILPATFNTIHLFDTRKSGRHFVMPVAPNARSKRLCWNGWWTSRQDERNAPSPAEPVDPPEPTGVFRFH